MEIMRESATEIKVQTWSYCVLEQVKGRIACCCCCFHFSCGAVSRLTLPAQSKVLLHFGDATVYIKW